MLAMLILASYPGAVLGRTSFVVRDFGLFGYPLAYFHRLNFWQGQLPLWDPLNSCGLPFLAQWNTLTLYPLSLIYLLLPLPWSVSLFCLVHLFWGGLGMHVLARRWSGCALASGLAGVIFSFNGLALNFLMWPNMVAAYGWLPWVIWLVQRGWQEGGKSLVWATLAGAMQMLSGGPETILLTWVFLFLLACGEWLWDSRNGLRPRIFLRFFATAILVALVCAAQLLPFLQLLSHCQRDSSLGAAEWAMPLWGWANFFVPMFRASPTTQGWVQQPGQFWTSSYYAGVSTLLLAAVAVWRVRNWRVHLLAAITALCLILALGTRAWLYSIFYSYLPGFRLLRYPVKSVILVLALMPLLAAFGLEALIRKARRCREGTDVSPASEAGAAPAGASIGSGGEMPSAIGPGLRHVVGSFEFSCVLVSLLLIGAIVWFGWRFPGPDQDWPATWRNGLARGGFLAGIFSVIIVFLKSAGRRRMLLAGLLLMLFWLDFMTHMPDQNPTVRPSVYAPGWASAHVTWDGAPPKPGESRLLLAPVAHQALRSLMLADPAENYLLNRQAFFADCNLLENVPTVYGFYSLTPRETYHAIMLSYIHLEREFPVLLDFMAVTQTTSLGKTAEWVRRPTAMPFVTAGQQPVFAEDNDAFEAFSRTNVDLRQVAFLPPQAQAQISATRQPAAQAQVTSFANQRISILTEAPATCLLVLSQSYYPAWKAYVEGRRVRIWRANYAFQALEIPAGSHQVELRYEDNYLLAGAVLSGLGLMACATLWFAAHLRNPRLVQTPSQ
jgi:hypothetical protein